MHFFKMKFREQNNMQTYKGMSINFVVIENYYIYRCVHKEKSRKKRHNFILCSTIIQQKAFIRFFTKTFKTSNNVNMNKNVFFFKKKKNRYVCLIIFLTIPYVDIKFLNVFCIETSNCGPVGSRYTEFLCLIGGIRYLDEDIKNVNTGG